jgi:hypothetical protein
MHYTEGEEGRRATADLPEANMHLRFCKYIDSSALPRIRESAYLVNVGCFQSE